MGNTVEKAQQAEPQEGDQQEDETSDFTCEICIEPVVSSKKFKNGGACSHPFCLDCIAKYIEVKVEDHTGYIKCPGLSCNQALDPHACRIIISKPVFEKWCDLALDSTLLQYESCYCPYRACSALVLNECREELKKVDCPNCKKKFCFQCKIPWHAGYQCRESGHLRDRNDILVGQLIEVNNWTRCYNCGHSVERVSGCLAITCKCGVVFCHICGERFHFGSCKSKSKSCATRCWSFLVVVFIMVMVSYIFALAVMMILSISH